MRKFKKALKFLRAKVFKPYVRMGAMRLIIFYQKHHTHHTCPYKPTCSEYTLQAINNRGIILGILAGGFRLLRCNPFTKGGFDPPPERLFKYKWVL